MFITRFLLPKSDRAQRLVGPKTFNDKRAGNLSPYQPVMHRAPSRCCATEELETSTSKEGKKERKKRPRDAPPKRTRAFVSLGSRDHWARSDELHLQDPDPVYRLHAQNPRWALSSEVREYPVGTRAGGGAKWVISDRDLIDVPICCHEGTSFPCLHSCQA